MTFKSMDAVRRLYPCKPHELQEGEFVIYGIGKDIEGNPVFDEFPLDATMTYRPPGTNMVYTAPVTTDPNKADKSGTNGHFWYWDGCLDKPTCKPSFGVPATGPYTWHGWLTNGRWEAV